MRVVAEAAGEALGGESGHFPYDYLEDLVRDKRKIDNLVILSRDLIAVR